MNSSDDKVIQWFEKAEVRLTRSLMRVARPVVVVFLTILTAAVGLTYLVLSRDRSQLPPEMTYLARLGAGMQVLVPDQNFLNQVDWEGENFCMSHKSILRIQMAPGDPNLRILRYTPSFEEGFHIPLILQGADGQPAQQHRCCPVVTSASGHDYRVFRSPQDLMQVPTCGHAAVKKGGIRARTKVPADDSIPIRCVNLSLPSNDDEVVYICVERMSGSINQTPSSNGV